MRNHMHIWRYPGGGTALRVCTRCARWQTIDPTDEFAEWTWQDEA